MRPLSLRQQEQLKGYRRDQKDWRTFPGRVHLVHTLLGRPMTFDHTKAAEEFLRRCLETGIPLSREEIESSYLLVLGDELDATAFRGEGITRPFAE